MNILINDIKTNKPLQISNNTLNKQVTFTARTEFSPSAELEQYKKAQQYADSIIKKHGTINLEKCDLKQLEGIQHGIEAFEGLNIKQIYFLYKHLSTIMLMRGCSNGCVHCYADAKPIATNLKPSQINSMSWEDFNSITSGFKKLDERLGFNKNNKNPIAKPFIIPFHDADSMEIIIKDKNGKEYDMTDIAKVIKNDMDRAVLFDTAGWDPKSTKMQQRAEKYVEFLKTSDDFISIHISLNPFHKLHAKYIEYLKSDPVKASKYRKLYTDRMANVFYTFTPLFEKKNFRLLNRAISESGNCDPNYKKSAHQELISEIREKLKEKYIESGMSRDEVTHKMNLFDKKTMQINTKKLFATGRMENLFPKYSKEHILPKILHKLNIKFPQDVVQKHAHLLIDCNGKAYMADLIDVIPTDIQMNINNKDKTTIRFQSDFKKILTTDELLTNSRTLFNKIIRKLLLTYK